MPDPIKLLTAEEPTGTASNGLPKPTAQHGGGKFKSERQRRYMWAVVPRAAKRWAHNRGTSKSMWSKRRPARPSVTRAPSSRGRRHKRDRAARPADGPL